MRELNTKQVEEVSGAFSCTFVNTPLNWAAIGGATLAGAFAGWPGAIVSGGTAYLAQRWDCRF